jgi:hypothetical protein
MLNSQGLDTLGGLELQLLRRQSNVASQQLNLSLWQARRQYRVFEQVLGNMHALLPLQALAHTRHTANWKLNCNQGCLEILKRNAGACQEKGGREENTRCRRQVRRKAKQIQRGNAQGCPINDRLFSGKAFLLRFESQRGDQTMVCWE